MSKSATIVSFNKSNSKEVMLAILAALVPVEEEFGLTFSAHGGVIDDLATVFKVRGAVKPTKANMKAKADAEQADWNGLCELFDLKPHHYGMTVQGRRGAYTLIGFRLKSKEYPIQARGADGRVYGLPAEEVLRQVGGVKSAKKSAKSKVVETKSRKRRGAKVAADDEDGPKQTRRQRRAARAKTKPAKSGKKPMSAAARKAFAEKMKAAREASAERKAKTERGGRKSRKVRGAKSAAAKPRRTAVTKAKSAKRGTTTAKRRNRMG